MMYIESPEGQIHVDFARRAGQLLLQYEQFKRNLPADARYEATLTITLLQSLSTSFQELSRDKSRKMNQAFKDFLALPLESLPPRMGIDPQSVDWNWRELGSLRYREVMGVIRNSLSHPLPQNSAARWPVTGYTAIATADGQIGAYRFTQSPWINRKGSDFGLYYSAGCEARESAHVEKRIADFISDNGLKVGADAIVMVERGGKFRPSLNGEDFAPVITIEMTVEQLRLFTLELADLIANAGHTERLRAKTERLHA